MKNNTLYFIKRGANNNDMPGDIKNYRVSTVENIDELAGNKSVYVEFTHCCIYSYRKTHKITGRPLKKAIQEVKNSDGLHMDTCFTNEKGSWRNSKIEREIWDKALDYNTSSILEAINTYSPTKYTKIVFVEDAATAIIKKIGGYREKAILENDPVFSTDGTTWNNEHKIVKVYSRVNHKIAESCEVDILNGTITN